MKIRISIKGKDSLSFTVPKGIDKDLDSIIREKLIEHKTSFDDVLSIVAD